ncbi:longitudinals lacking protein, isoforms A/B/D/L-like [Melanaphis sacchari]|uniref:longitudinals lacking protein, isoforms A/B/D/L-like n=1 Tax=Melanaphis sacchari TaxID=742174 RepID=UPI000DC14BDB|nr:longitudinals lacking protein, isoforms A/B/D/L-like [Melanaphis sacchari]
MLHPCFLRAACQEYIDFSLDPTECPNMCGRSYKGKFRKSSLRRHLIYECGVDPQFKCPVCQKIFTDKSSMKRHAVTIHFNNKN